MKPRVLLGLSGGVDSAIAALILKRQGYDVIAVFIKSFSETKNKITGTCSWREEYREAQKIASILDLKLIKLDLEKEYVSQVVRPMIQAYKKGITPNPDITCNTLIKFPLLWKTARKLKAEYIATGHHARIKKTKKGYELHRGKDELKDQSYFLYELTQHDLAHTLMPIGELTKEQVRSIAQKNKFPNFDRQSSRGVCFIGNVPLKQFLEPYLKSRQGNVLDEKENIIGTHNGAHYYTLGERARPSMGITLEKGTHAQERFFIASKNMKKNTITVVPSGHTSLSKGTFELKSVHWIHEEDKKGSLKAHVRIRHLGTLIPARLSFKGNHAQFTTSKPLQGVAPGQSAVFYQGTRLVCGGEITT